MQEYLLVLLIVRLINDFIDITVFERSMKKKSFIYESSK